MPFTFEQRQDYFNSLESSYKAYQGSDEYQKNQISYLEFQQREYINLLSKETISEDDFFKMAALIKKNHTSTCFYINPSTQNSKGQTILHKVIEDHVKFKNIYDFKGLIDYLGQYSKETINIKNVAGKTALQCLLNHTWPSSIIANVLIKHGADPMSQNDQGDTIFHLLTSLKPNPYDAEYYQNQRVLHPIALYSCKDVNLTSAPKNNKRQTPLQAIFTKVHITTDTRLINAGPWLLEHHANPNDTCLNGNTIVHILVTVIGDLSLRVSADKINEFIQLFITKGGNILAENNQGKTALQLAEQGKNLNLYTMEQQLKPFVENAKNDIDFLDTAMVLLSFRIFPPYVVIHLLSFHHNMSHRTEASTDKKVCSIHKSIEQLIKNKQPSEEVNNDNDANDDDSTNSN